MADPNKDHTYDVGNMGGMDNLPFPLLPSLADSYMEHLRAQDIHHPAFPFQPHSTIPEELEENHSKTIQPLQASDIDKINDYQVELCYPSTHMMIEGREVLC
ncbi:hypothetical protein D3C78_1115140 [compost metagenome]